MSSELIILTATSIFVLFIALVVNLSHGVKKWTKTLFSAVCISLVLWQATIYVADSVQTNLTFLNNLVFLWPTFCVAAAFFFALILNADPSQPSLRKEITHNRTPSLVVSIGALVQLVLIITGSIFTQVTNNAHSDVDTYIRGNGYPLYIGILCIQLLTLTLYLIRNLYHTKRGTQEHRAVKTVLTTISTVIVYALLTNVIIPLLTGSQNYIYFGIFSIDIFAIGFAFSIIRYKFLNVRIYALRAGVYLLSSAVLILIYVLFVSIVITNALNVQLSNQVFALLAGLTLVMAMSFQSVKGYFNKITNKLFYRDYYDPQMVLDRLSNLLVGAVELDEIRSGSIQVITSALKPSHMVYLLRNDSPHGYASLLKILSHCNEDFIVLDESISLEQKTLIKDMQKHDIAAAIRLQTTHEDIGFMLLGPRQSGATYSSGDKRLLRTAADEIAIGLQNALRFEEIENFNIKLRAEVERATLQLRHTNDKLRKMDQTKDDFISMASHQLRTPLTSVKGYVSMVLDGDVGALNRKQRDYLSQVFISSQRMSYLISDLLNVSRLRTGKFIIDRNPCNLAAVVHEEVSQLIETAKARNLTLSYNQPEHFPTLMLDEMKMRQVIMNFIDNAIYYTPSGGGITVTLTENPQSIEFTVTDTGIGVPKSEQHHLFSKFFRAQNARIARPDGTGLGLFMAKKVITVQGGAIIFRSREGKGSTFGFTMPKTVVGVDVPNLRK